MAEPVSPVFRDMVDQEVVYGEGQPGIKPLPCLKLKEGALVVSRWKLSWKERFLVLLFGDVYLYVHTFNEPLQPVHIEIETPAMKQI